MKRIITTSIILLSGFLYSQVVIGSDTPSSTDAILDFGTGENLGVVLPKITDSSTITDAGSLYYDATAKKVMFRGTTSVLDLSVEGASTAYNPLPLNYADLEEVGDGVVLGAETATASGVLVLESSDKAMVLPRVADPHLTIQSPEPGTIVFDTTSKMLCIYNGEQWAFWGK